MRALARSAPRTPALRIPAAAVGALAFGALAIGALAIASLAISRLAVKRARFGKVEIDDLTVRRLRVIEEAKGDEIAVPGLPIAAPR
jgi:hypothetical protein